MKIHEIVEQEDGSALVSYELTSEEVQLILSTTITKALTEFVEKMDKATVSIEEVDDDGKSEADLGNT
jgi:RNA-binding protein YlmH